MDKLEAGRQAFADRDWAHARRLLEEADATACLKPDDLERLASAARWSGDSEAVFEPLERAFAAHRSAGAAAEAAEIALALAQASVDAAQPSVAAGWLAQAHKLLAEQPECAAQARLLWMRGRHHADQGDLEAHEAAARQAYAMAVRVGSQTVEALTLADLGHVAAARGLSSQAMGLMGQALALAVTGAIPILEAGLVYCQAVSTCRSQGEWSRACEWTETIDRWIQREQVEYFPGLCRIHRSEVTRHRGSLEEAEGEALEAIRLLELSIPRWLGLAQAELGEVRRRRGDLPGALEAFRAAMEQGWEPQPGLALVLLEQGDPLEAHRSMERFFAGPMSTWLAEDRTNLMKARVSTAIAAGDLDGATQAVAALSARADQSATDWDRAAAQVGTAQLRLATGEPSAAIRELRAARRLLAEVDAPFERAWAGVLLGQALDASGERVTARLELEAAQGVFERIGARGAATRSAALLREHEGRSPAPDSPAGASRPERAAEPLPARFVCEGDVWTLAVGSAEARLKDGRGPRYIALLLATPGRELLAADLVSRVGGGAGGDGALGAEAMRPSDAGEILDPRARQAYEARVRELREAIVELEQRGDPDGVDAARQEIEAIARELAQAIGLGGRHRRAGSSNERARQSVTKAIRTAIRRIEQVDPGLGRMLESSIRTGTFCSYSPDPRLELRWQL